MDRYTQRWPLIPEEELLGSSVNVGSAEFPLLVLLHKRRITTGTLFGDAPALGCVDCLDAFSTKSPRSRKYALANDMWLGRPDPLLWQANLTHELRLGLARMVATKMALRAGEPRSSSPPCESVGPYVLSVWIYWVFGCLSQRRRTVRGRETAAAAAER